MRISIVAAGISLLAACESGPTSTSAPDAAPSIANADECLGDAVGTWRLQGTLPVQTCGYDNPSPEVFSSELTISVSQQLGVQVITLAANGLGSSAGVRDKPTVLFAGGQCTISGVTFDPNDGSSDTIAFEYRSAAQAKVSVTHTRGCSTSFVLVGDR